MIEEIKNNGTLLGIIVRNNFYKEGVYFFTQDNLSLQLAYMNHSAGELIQPHIHNHIKREIYYTKEVLIIKKGKIRIDFYDDAKHYLESRVLEAGDIVFLSEGGHGIVMLEDTQFFEVKQGPYAGEGDKIRFEGKGIDFQHEEKKDNK
jgi:mannose-6-phosphate isomerase-like protein (cupin superfamily)